VPYLLDSNAYRLALLGDERLARRLEALPENESVFVSVIAIREKMVGLLGAITAAENARSRESLPTVYDFLTRYTEEITYYPAYPYSPAADALFRSWGNWSKAVGKNDCRIAASAIVGGLSS
jgi:predicted nucleic acid-binding protein